VGENRAYTCGPTTYKSSRVQQDPKLYALVYLYLRLQTNTVSYVLIVLYRKRQISAHSRVPVTSSPTYTANIEYPLTIKQARRELSPALLFSRFSRSSCASPSESP
jgi:hypothetical protein